jgi:hypothetical protein
MQSRSGAGSKDLADERPFSCLAEDAGVVACSQGDVSEFKLREGSGIRALGDDLLRRVDGQQNTAIVVTEEVGSTQGKCMRSLAAHILRHVSHRHTHKVLAGLRLIEYLVPDAVYSIEMHVNPPVKKGQNTRIMKLRLYVASFDPCVPTTVLSSEMCAILRPEEQDRLRELLDLAHAFEGISVPVETKEDRRKVRTLAASIATTDDALLSEWGRAALYAPEPARKFATALYRATVEWCVGIINDVWSTLLGDGPNRGTSLVLVRAASVDGTKFGAFAGFVAGECIAQHIAELLPLVDIGTMPPSMRPAVDEIPCLRDTAFAYAAQALFGESGFLHFLTSGWRSEAAITSYVEMIRDGDLAMRRYFGPRMREAVRIRAGDSLVPFDVLSLSAATVCEPFGAFDVGRADGPKWLGRDRKYPPKSRILRLVSDLDACLKVFRGDAGIGVVVYSDDDIKRPLLPAAARLVYLWRDQVRIDDLAKYTMMLGLGDDPAAVIASVFGDAFQSVYAAVGDELHFAPGKLQELYRALEAHAIKHDIRQVPGPSQTTPVSGLPHSWVMRKKQRATAVDWAGSVPFKPPVRNSAIRAPLKEVAQLDLERLDAAWADQSKAAHYHQPKDSRRKPQAVDHGHNYRLMFMTNRYVNHEDLIARAQEDAENLHFATGFFNDEDAKQLYGADPESDRFFASQREDLHGIPKSCINRMNKFRSVFKANRQRSSMAVLQMEHVAAAKIQLAWFAYTVLRQEAARRIQAFYRARLFREIMRGISQAKVNLIDEDYSTAKRIMLDTGLAKQAERLTVKDVHLVLPYDGGSTFSAASLMQRVTTLISRHIGIPKDLDHRIISILATEADSQKGTLTLKMSLPYRLVPIVDEIQHSIDLDVTKRSRISPLVEIIDQIGGWEVTQNKSPVAAKRAAAAGRALALGPDPVLASPAAAAAKAKRSAKTEAGRLAQGETVL